MKALTPSRNTRLTALSCLAVLGIILSVAILVGDPAAVPSVQAYACQAANLPVCSLGDTTRTSSLYVSHAVTGGASGTPVQPDDGETWNITAYWNEPPGPPSCAQATETASATAYYTGSGWALSNVTTTTNIVDIDICDKDTCAREDTQSHGYELIVDIRDPIVIVTKPYNLRQVVFTTTSVDGGYELDTAACSLGSSVSPTSQAFTQTDGGPWPCGYSCAAAAGPSLTITYE